MRAAQALRAARMMPELALLMETISQSAEKVSAIVFLMAMAIYVFAIVGVTVMGANDPFHFGTIGRAMVTLFRVATLDGWPEILYYNMFGCRGWGDYSEVGVWLRAPVSGLTSSGATAMASNNDDGSNAGSLPGPPAEEFGRGLSSEELSAELAPFVTRQCEHEPFPVFTPLYFLLYISLSAYLMLNLFIGTIVGTMDRVQSEFQEREDEARAWAKERGAVPVLGFASRTAKKVAEKADEAIKLTTHQTMKISGQSI
jgi:hypothetical protein